MPSKITVLFLVILSLYCNPDFTGTAQSQKKSFDLFLFDGYGITFTASDEEKVEAVSKSFQNHCYKCHNPNGVGPDLFDSIWSHGKSSMDIFKVVYLGVGRPALLQKPSKGPMPAYRDQIPPEKIWDIALWLSGEFRQKDQ